MELFNTILFSKEKMNQKLSTVSNLILKHLEVHYHTCESYFNSVLTFIDKSSLTHCIKISLKLCSLLQNSSPDSACVLIFIQTCIFYVKLHVKKLLLLPRVLFQLLKQLGAAIYQFSKNTYFQNVILHFLHFLNNKLII